MFKLVGEIGGSGVFVSGYYSVTQVNKCFAFKISLLKIPPVMGIQMDGVKLIRWKIQWPKPGSGICHFCTHSVALLVLSYIAILICGL